MDPREVDGRKQFADAAVASGVELHESVFAPAVSPAILDEPVPGAVPPVEQDCVVQGIVACCCAAAIEDPA